MKVRHRTLFIISMALFAAFCYSAISRLLFLVHAERAVGVVREVWAENSVCGSGRRRQGACTKFFATVEFQTADGSQSTRFQAGYARNHDQPLSRAVYHVGDRVPLVFDPNHTKAVYRDQIGGFLGFLFVLLLLQIVTLMASLQVPETENRRHAKLQA